MVDNARAVELDAPLITGEELLGMTGIGPCELIDGRIVPMVPTGGEHAVIETTLSAELRNFVEARDLGWVMGGEVGIYTRRNPDRVRGADIAFLSKQRAGDLPPRGFLQTPPELVVEIVSPTDAWRELEQKVEEYLAIGVERVWVVDPEGRSVRVYRSPTELSRLAEDDLLRGEGALEGFEMPVRSIFPS